MACFAGAGGGILASSLLGWSTLAAIEIEQYPRDVLIQRQRDGCLPTFPIYRDIRHFDGRPWRGIIDVVSGGFPCQDISSAGTGQGLAGDRSGLWFEMLRVIEEVRPRYVFAENSPHLRTRGLGTVIKGLAGLGYDTRWCVLGAWHTGAPHKRNRMWVYARHAIDAKVAYPSVIGLQRQGPHGHQGGATQDCKRQTGQLGHGGQQHQWEVEPRLGRVANGMANRVDRLRAIGNGQVPQCAALAWRILHGAGQ